MGDLAARSIGRLVSGLVWLRASIAGSAWPAVAGIGAIAAIAAVSGGCALFASERAPEVPRVAVSDGWLAMGTFFEVDLRVPPGGVARAREFIEWSRREIVRLERIYSRHDADSEVAGLNRAMASAEALTHDLEIGAELEALLFGAVEVWEATGGAFDITIGPLIDVWIRAAAREQWPSLESLRQAKRRVGSGRLLLPGEGRLGVTVAGMRIDLDAISKGAVLDRLAERLDAELPGAAALLSFGQSSLVAIGDPDESDPRGPSGWRLEIRSRGAAGEVLGVVRLRDRALSVSSSVGSVSRIGGESVSHVVDPRTGIAVEGTVEAVVVGDRAATADAFSTALLVLGAERTALERAERAGVDAIVFESRGRTLFTEGWDALTVAARGPRNQ